MKSLTFTPLSFLRKALLCIKSDCLFAVNGAELWNQKQVLYSPSACDYALGRNKKGRVPSLETDGIPTLLYHPDSLSLRHMEQLPPLVWVIHDILIMSISPSGHESESARASFCLVSFPWTSHFNCHLQRFHFQLMTPSFWHGAPQGSPFGLMSFSLYHCFSFFHPLSFSYKLNK